MESRVITLQQPWRAAPLERLMLWLALLQGSSFTLSIALNLPTGQAPALAALVTLLWGMMYLMAATALFAAYGVNWITWLVRYRLPLILLIVICLVSPLWSIDPRLSLERSLHLFGTTVIAVYIGLRLPLSEIIRISAHALALLMVFSIIAALFIPALGLVDYDGRIVWRGVTASKNTLGFWAAVTIILFVFRAASRRRLSSRLGDIAIIVLAALCLTQSVSATSVLALFTALLVMFYVYAATDLELGALAMVVIGVLVCALTFLAFRSIDTAELIGRSGDLTGRTQVWSETWQLILQRPFTGFGYGTLWFPTQASIWIQESLTDFNWTVYHAHNGLLQIASEVGLPATILTVVLLIQQLIETIWCQYRRPQPGLIFVLGFFVALLISNYSEARLLVNRDLFWILLIALPISMLQQVTVTSVEGTLSPGPWYARQNRDDGSSRRETLARRRNLKERLRKHHTPAIRDDSDVVAEQTERQS